MSLTREFTIAAAGWVAQEKKLETRSARPTSLAQQVLPSAPEAVLADALRHSPQFFTPIEDMRGRLSTLLSDPTGMNALFNVALDSIARDVNSIGDLCAELTASCTALKDGLEAPPPRVDPATISARLTALDDIASRLDQASRGKMDAATTEERTASVVDLILRLVDDGTLAEDEVRDYVAQNPVAKTVLEATKIQRVESLGDRYWRLVSSADQTEDASSLPTSRASIPSAAGIQLTDEQGRPVELIGGFESATLLPDGTLLVRGDGSGLPAGEIREFSITPITPEAGSRIAASSALTTLGISELGSAREAVEEDLRFDVWGCLMLDLSERIDAIWARISNKINSIYYKVRNTMASLVSGEFLQGLPTLEVNWQGALSKVFELSGLDLGDPLAAANGLIGVINNVGKIQLGGSQGAYCDLEQERYCALHGALLDLKVELARLEQRANIKLSGQNLSDLAAALGWDPVAVRAEIEAALAPLDAFFARGEAARQTLRGQVCSWVRNRLASTPPALQELLDATLLAAGLLSGILALLGLPALGVPVDLRAISEVLKLSSMGFTEMEESLENLDLAQVLGLPDGALTKAGKTSDVLSKAAQQSATIPRSQQLDALAVGVRDRDRQLTQHQIMRATMQARYHAPKGGMVAEAVAQQGAALCMEVDREADSIRR